VIANINPALKQVLFRSIRTTFPLLAMQCKNSYDLLRGWRSRDFTHPKINERRQVSGAGSSGQTLPWSRSSHAE